MDYLKDLNSAQKQAVEATEGPVLVLAGAGAGKTKTIAHRIGHLIAQGVAPQKILAVTFTNKAAKEMRERVVDLLQEGGVHLSYGNMPTVLTFHALGVMILREHATTLDLPRHFTILDRSDSLRAIKEAEKVAGVDPKQFEPRTVLSAISKQKGKGVTLQQYAEYAGNQYAPRIIAEVWGEYQKIVRREKALDFDDLLLVTLELLRHHKGILEEYQNRWSYLHIDEYQDTNKVQYELVRLLAAQHKNIFCVGDVDQNVYSWRGSTIENILGFEKEYPETQLIRLEQNYRSTKTIVEASNHIIKKNKRRKEKTLFTENAQGEKMTLYMAYDEDDEARFVAEKAHELTRGGVQPEEIAVLYRANFQSRALEDAMLARGVPYRVLGTRFFERKEIKDTLAYIRAALSEESTGDVRRIINVPPRGIGAVTVEKFFSLGMEALSPVMRSKIDDFFVILQEIRIASKEKKVSELVRFAFARSGLEQFYKKEDEEERLENVRELVTLATKKYDPLPTQEEGVELLLADAALASDQDELEQKGAGVTLMTVHAAKGLEFPYVFITGMEDGLFPHQRLSDEGVDEEEERRLFYVALTRAMKKVFLSYANIRTIYGSRQARLPSEFVTDLDERFLEVAEELASHEPRGKVIYLEM